jgi:hypothetical protein
MARQIDQRRQTTREYLDSIPPMAELLNRLDQTKAEAKLLRRLMRIAVERDQAGHDGRVHASR